MGKIYEHCADLTKEPETKESNERSELRQNIQKHFPFM